MITTKIKVNILILCCLTFGQYNSVFARQNNTASQSKVSIVIDKSLANEVFGASKIESALKKLNISSQVVDKSVATCTINSVSLKVCIVVCSLELNCLTC